MTKLVEARPAIVTYYDLCEYSGVSRQEFFGESTMKTMVKVGYTVVDDEFTRVMHEIDMSDDEECEGIVIPNSLVVEVKWMIPEDPDAEIADAN